MTYNKPEVALLGNAGSVIQNNVPKSASPVEPPSGLIAPNAAYDLDE